MAANLVVHSLDIWDVHVVCGRTDIFILLSSEDVDTHHVDLCIQINNNHVTQSHNSVASPMEASVHLSLFSHCFHPLCLTVLTCMLFCKAHSQTSRLTVYVPGTSAILIQAHVTK